MQIVLTQGEKPWPRMRPRDDVWQSAGLSRPAEVQKRERKERDGERKSSREREREIERATDRGNIEQRGS